MKNGDIRGVKNIFAVSQLKLTLTACEFKLTIVPLIAVIIRPIVHLLLLYINADKHLH